MNNKDFFSKYERDRLKMKLIWTYLSFLSFSLIIYSLFLLFEEPYGTNIQLKDEVKQVYIPKKIEPINNVSPINIINNGTANITINNNYYSNTNNN